MSASQDLLWGNINPQVSEESLENADLNTLASYVASLYRHERFVDGLISERVDRGILPKVWERMLALTAESN